jgi:hypothetical protein
VQGLVPWVPVESFMGYGGKCLFLAAAALLAFPEQPSAGGYYEEYSFLGITFDQDNILAAGSGFTNLISWGRSNWT